MKLNETLIRYLLLLLDCQKTMGDNIKSTTLAEAMGECRALAHNRIVKLEQKGIIVKKKYGKINFTEAGFAVAADFERKYNDILHFFYDILNLEYEESVKNAYAFLGNLSIESLEGMQRFVKNERVKADYKADKVLFAESGI